MRLHSFTSFKETVDIVIRLNVNPKNGEQVVRGSVTMPAGLGKSVVVGVFCSKDELEELEAAGVTPDVHVTEADLKKVQ